MSLFEGAHFLQTEKRSQQLISSNCSKTASSATMVSLRSSFTTATLFHVPELVYHRPEDTNLVAKEAAVGWLPVCSAAGNPADQFEVEYTWDQRDTRDTTEYLAK